MSNRSRFSSLGQGGQEGARIRIRTDRPATFITTVPLHKAKPISINHLNTCNLFPTVCRATILNVARDL
jgi:hypothetical protein